MKGIDGGCEGKVAASYVRKEGQGETFYYARAPRDAAKLLLGGVGCCFEETQLTSTCGMIA